MKKIEAIDTHERSERNILESRLIGKFLLLDIPFSGLRAVGGVSYRRPELLHPCNRVCHSVTELHEHRCVSPASWTYE